eukprot:jgi/Ulvmu1/11231/UM073_0003.1
MPVPRLQQREVCFQPLTKRQRSSILRCKCTTGRVLLTREAGKNGPLRNKLAGEGISTVECPMVQTVDGPDKAALVVSLQAPKFAWVTVTSPESARVFAEAWDQAGRPDVNIASVGKGTSRILEQHSPSLTPAFVPSKANAETLSAELPAPAAGDAAVLYPASQRAQHTLQDGLTARGFRVTRLDTYSTKPVKTVPEPELQAALACAVVAVAAPSALKAWLRIAGDSAAKARPVACIGSTSGRAALRLGWREDHVFWPDSPGLEGFVDSVKDALRHRAAADVS